jgi:glycosyltransferase involved in cell wall biosynthesis
MGLPKISVVLPVRNEARWIGQLLDQLMQQTYPSEAYEILVADGCSTDTTRTIVLEKARKSQAAIRLIDNSGIRSGSGRNAGLAAATGDIILFIDGHCEIPSTRLLADTALLLEETGADCLCRPQPLIAFSPRGIGKIIADVRASTLGHGRDSLIYDMRHAGFVDPASSGATYRRAIFSRLGAYDESFDACEDVEFNTRVAAAGYKAYTDPRLAVFYAPRQSVVALFRQMARYGVGRVRLARKHPEGISRSQWAPVMLLAFLFLGILSVFAAAETGFWPIVLAAVPAAFFLAIVLAASADLGRRHGWRHVVIGPAAYFAVYCGLGWGMCKESLRAFFKRPHLESPAVLKKESESERDRLIKEEWQDQSGSAP